MKAVLPLALVSALAVGTAYAAGSSGSSTEDSSQEPGYSSQSGQSSSSMSSHHQHMSKSEVKQIQSKLKEQGYKVGSVDGKMGKGTQQALRQFQQDKGIQATGKPDQETLAALNVSPGGTQQGQLPQGHSRSHANPGGGNAPGGGEENMGSPATPGGEQGGGEQGGGEQGGGEGR